MGTVTVVAEQRINAPAEKVQALVADYQKQRPAMLTEHFRDYQVVEGGVGAGTVAKWTLQATSKRVRHVVATVTEPTPGTLVETDANSSMVTTWAVRSEGDASVVRIESTWQGAGGVAGFFEKTFAPLGLRRIYNGMLTTLAESV